MTLLDRYVTERQLPDNLQLPPGPKLPPIVQTILFLTRRDFAAPRWRQRYGDVFSIYVAPEGHGVVLSNPEHIREVFAGPPDTFHAGEGNAVLGPIMGEHSVLLLDEDAHKAARKKVMGAFHGETMRSWGEVIAQLAADSVASWPSGVPFAVHPRMNDISLEVILRIVFGVSDEARLAEMRPLLQRLVRIGPTIFARLDVPAPGSGRSVAAVRAAKARVDALALRRDRRTAAGHRSRRPQGRAVQAARGRPGRER